jgi:hypothetical protein
VSLETQIALLERDRGRALAGARHLLVQAEASQSLWLASSARYLAGTLEGGQAGGEQRRLALDYLAREGWKHPERSVALHCPALECEGLASS